MAESLWRRVLFSSHPSAGQKTPKVLVVTDSASDHAFYQSFCAKGEWDVQMSSSVEDAIRLLTAEAFPLVVFDRDLAGWDWRDVLARISACSPRSCFLLMSRVSDEYLWREVVAHGGYDVLPKPLTDPRLSKTLQRALYYWKAERSPV